MRSNLINDLLNIKWKKNMLMYNPAVAGPGNANVWALRTIMGEAFLRAIAEQEPFILKDERLIAEWLTHGKYPLALFAPNTAILEFQRGGAPLDSVSPKEGTRILAGAGFLSLPKKAPHPNASKVFINWFLSKEGQTVYVKASQLQSAREDIPIELVSPDLRRQPGLKYYNFVSEEELLGESNRIRFAMDIFGPLIKK